MKKYILIILFAFLISMAALSYAEESARESITVDNSVIEKEIPTYRMSLQRLIQEAEKKLKKIDKEIKNQENELIARELLEDGNTLYSESKLKEAKAKWNEALKITKDPSFKKYLKENEKRFRKETADAARLKKLEEKAKKKAAYKAKIEEKKRKRAEIKKQKELEKARKKAERKALLESKKKAKATSSNKK